MEETRSKGTNCQTMLLLNALLLAEYSNAIGENAYIERLLSGLCKHLETPTIFVYMDTESCAASNCHQLCFQVRWYRLSFGSDLACWEQSEGQPDRVELALRAYRRDSAESGRGESGDGTGRELALGRGSWQGREVVAECSSEEGTEEEMLQLAHRKLCFVREMRCCVSEGMDRVMQFLGTWSKRRHFHPCQGTPRDTDRDAAQISSIMSQMTFLLKQQSQLCHEMEQLSMQRLLDGPPLSSSRDRLPEVKGSSSVLGIKGGEKEGGMVIRRRSQEDAPRPSTSQPSAETAAESKERCLEGMVEQNARELAELKSLLRAVLTPNQGNREQ